MQNQIYAEIYSRNTYAELVAWGKEQALLAGDLQAVSLEAIYKNKLGGNLQTAIEMFQQELYMAASREVIQKNKAKVGRYLQAIHAQTFNALPEKFDTLLEIYNHHHVNTLTKKDFANQNLKLAAIEILRDKNIAFLRAILPKLVNIEISALNDNEVLKLRDAQLLDFEKLYLQTMEQAAPTVNQLDNMLRMSRGNTQGESFYVALPAIELLKQLEVKVKNNPKDLKLLTFFTNKKNQCKDLINNQLPLDKLIRELIYRVDNQEILGQIRSFIQELEDLNETARSNKLEAFIAAKENQFAYLVSNRLQLPLPKLYEDLEKRIEKERKERTAPGFFSSVKAKNRVPENFNLLSFI